MSRNSDSDGSKWPARCMVGPRWNAIATCAQCKMADDKTASDFLVHHSMHL